jgi:ribosomal protein L16 Arg81 hydroxylase
MIKRDNFFDFTFDFNDLTKMFCTYDFQSQIKMKHIDKYVLQGVFTVFDVHNYKPFYPLIKKCVEEFNLVDRQIDVYLFVAFSPGVCTAVHSDDYDIYLYSLYGETVFRVGEETYDLKDKDLLYVKKYTPHQGISLTPRIIFSLGVTG